MAYQPTFNGYPHQGGNGPAFSQQARFLQPNYIHKGPGPRNNRYGPPYRYPNNKNHQNNSYNSRNQSHQNQNRGRGRYRGRGNQSNYHQGNAGQNWESGHSANGGYRGKSNYHASSSRTGGDHPGSTHQSGLQYYGQHVPRRGAIQDSSLHLSQSCGNQNLGLGWNAQNPPNFLPDYPSHDRHQVQYSGYHAPYTGGHYQISQYDGQVDDGYRGGSSSFVRTTNGYSTDLFDGQTLIDASVPPGLEALVSNKDRDGDIIMENSSESNPWELYNYFHGHASYLRS
ncbi:hypothetical protein N7456_010505 [Penicillium angulare]|uniref:Uncharacterized protein n=1 Tax=Penicillium angulare TaxID=116970 RepID=A0A9W9F6S7_9EURO|nr:hypothetical protein N7456_010505 [Penicillium angulare]